jgi:hypothetical protein
MIVSPQKNQDEIAYTTILTILESGIKIYKTNPTEELWLILQEINESCTRLKKKIESHDYAPDDAREKRVWEIMDALKA